MKLPEEVESSNFRLNSFHFVLHSVCSTLWIAWLTEFDLLSLVWGSSENPFEVDQTLSSLYCSLVVLKSHNVSNAPFYIRQLP